MAEHKTDRRRVYTQQVIKEAFFELLEEKGSFEAVSVTDVCKRADINRSTFYLHYEDKYALLRALVREALVDDPAVASMADVPLCQRLPAAKPMQRLFRDPNLTSVIADCILEIRRDEVVPGLMERCGVDEEEALGLFTFMVNGSLAVSRALGWERNARWEKVRPCITRFVEGGEQALAQGE